MRRIYFRAILSILIGRINRDIEGLPDVLKSRVVR